jgi:NADPH-dependent curcumin reductase CurA
MMQQVNEKKLSFRTDILDGLEEAPRGLQRLLTGQNNGKVIIRVNRKQNVNESKL